ncbi:MAG: DUF6498-containing protein [Planctomycetota bacterium]|jgi:hypothetical protein
MSETNTNVRKKKPFYSDLSFWALFASNLIVIAWALKEGWSLAIIMWIYWSQSVFIGVFWFFKILNLKDFSTEGVQIGGQSVKPTKVAKKDTAVFFLLHYGFFHIVYSILLAGKFKSVPIFQILLPAGIFFLYQCFSFFYNKKWEAKGKPNIGTMFFFPYARIIPMHLTMCIALSDWGQRQALALFLSLKLLADIIMHMVEHRGFADPGPDYEKKTVILVHKNGKRYIKGREKNDLKGPDQPDP